MAWHDHFQTRSQTWKSLEIEALLVVALIGIDWQLANTAATVTAGVIVCLATVFGVLVTLHHRTVERRIFTHVTNIERMLGLLRPEVLSDTLKIPDPITLLDLMRFSRRNTSVFILRMHCALFLFTLIYVLASLLTRPNPPAAG